MIVIYFDGLVYTAPTLEAAIAWVEKGEPGNSGIYSVERTNGLKHWINYQLCRGAQKTEIGWITDCVKPID